MRRRRSKRISMPKLIVIIAVLLSVVYSGAWYMTATRFKQAVASQLDVIGKTQGITLSHGALSINGFPFRIEIRIEQPKLHNDLASVVDKPASDTPLPEQGTQNTPPAPEGTPASSATLSSDLSVSAAGTPSVVVVPAADSMTETPVSYEFYTDGAVGIGTDILGRHVTASIYGDAHQLLKKGERTWHAILHTGNVLTAHATLKHGLLWHILTSPTTSLTDTSDLPNQFERVALSGENMTLTDGTSGELLKSADTIRIELGNHPLNEKGISLHFSLFAKDYLSTPALDTFYASLTDEFSGLDMFGELPLASLSEGSSLYGKSNADIDIDIQYPLGISSLNPSQLFALDTSTRIIINRFSLSTAIGQNTITGSLDVTKSTDTTPESGHLILHTTHENSEQGYQAQVEYLKNSMSRKASNLPASSTSADSRVIRYLSAHPEELVAMIPKFHEMGKIETHIDIELKGGDQAIVINQADFVAKDYSAKLKGDYHQPEKSSLFNVGGKGKMTLQLTHYQKITKEATQYFGRVLTLLNKASATESAPIILSEQFNHDLDTLLVLLSDQPDAHSDDIAITLKNEGEQLLPTIGTLPFFQAAAKAQELLEPHFIPAKASAAHPAEPSALPETKSLVEQPASSPEKTK